MPRVMPIHVVVTDAGVATKIIAMLTPGGGVSASQAIGGGGDAEVALTLDANLDSNARVAVRKGVAVGPFKRRRLNLIEGANVTITVADDAADEEVDITIAAAGGGGTPASTVVAETSYGQASAVGTGTDYARNDHTHGTPGLAADLEENAAEALKSNDTRLFGASFGSRREGCAVTTMGTAALPASAAIACVLTTRSTASDGSDATATYRLHTTAASVGATGGWWIGGTGSASDLTQRRHLPRMRAVIKTGSDVTTCSIMVGFLSSEDPSDNPASMHQAVLQFSTALGDTEWKLTTKDGTTQTRGATGLAAPLASTRYVVDIWFSDSSTLNLQINGGAVVQATLTLPGVSTGLGIIAQVRPSAASARAIAISRIAWASA